MAGRRTHLFLSYIQVNSNQNAGERKQSRKQQQRQDTEVFYIARVEYVLWFYSHYHSVTVSSHIIYVHVLFRNKQKSQY